MRTTSFFSSFIVGLLLLSPFCMTTSVAQSNKPADSGQIVDVDKTLRQMLAEIRELRIAVERSTLTQTRFQMLVERLRIQQTQVDVLSRRLDDLRTQGAEIRAAKPQMEQQIKDAEDLLDQNPDSNRRLDLESRIKSMKHALAGFGPEEERIRAREAALETELQTAQVKLTELNNQLDALLNDMKAP